MISLFISIFSLILPQLNVDFNNSPYSKVDYLMDRDVFVKTTFNPINGDIYLYKVNNNTLFRINRNGEVVTLSTNLFEERTNANFVTHPNGEELRFWDAGVGRVFDYTFSESKLKRVDNSHNHMNQFGHASHLDSTGSIYALGGYGYWQLKNILIRYDQELGEWLEIKAENRDIVPESEYGYIIDETNRFYYLVNSDIKGGQKFSLFEFDKKRSSWSIDREGSYLLRNLNIDVNHFFIYSLTYSVDKENHLVSILSYGKKSPRINFFDYKRKRLYQVNPEQYGLYSPRAIFYSEIDQKWVILGHPINVNERNRLIILTLNTSDIKGIIEAQKPPFWITNPIASTSSFALIIFTLFVGIYKGVEYYRNEFVNNTSRSEIKPVEIILTGTDVSKVLCNGREINIKSDHNILKFWNTVSHIVKKKLKHISLSDFDDMIFHNNTESSNRTRERNKIIDRVNSMFKEPIITTRRSENDKRMKIIHLKTDLIQITEKD